MKYGDITIMFLNTGLRASELMNLEWTDYFKNGTTPYIKIRESKTETGIRIIPLVPTANEIIKRQLHLSKYIFTSSTGDKITQTILKKHNKKLRDKTGIEDFTNHICRHTFATNALEHNMNIKALSNILGHTDVAFTMRRYTDANIDFLFDEIKNLGRSLTPQTHTQY